MEKARKRNGCASHRLYRVLESTNIMVMYRQVTPAALNYCYAPSCCRKLESQTGLRPSSFDSSACGMQGRLKEDGDEYTTSALRCHHATTAKPFVLAPAHNQLA